MPTISPGRTDRLTRFTAAMPASSSTTSSCSARRGSLAAAPGFAADFSACARGISRVPTIICASRVVSRSATAPPPVSLPRRSTVAASANAMTSRNLCVIISTVTLPPRARPFSMPSTSSASSGVRTELGSSRIMKRRRR